MEIFDLIVLSLIGLLSIFYYWILFVYSPRKILELGNTLLEPLKLVISSREIKRNLLSVDSPYYMGSFEGVYKERKIECIYKQIYFKNKIKLEITTKPRQINIDISEVPRYKLESIYQKNIYKDYNLIKDTGVHTARVISEENKLNTDDYKIILDDLIKACEMVEQGEV